MFLKCLKKNNNLYNNKKNNKNLYNKKNKNLYNKTKIIKIYIIIKKKIYMLFVNTEDVNILAFAVFANFRYLAIVST